MRQLTIASITALAFVAGAFGPLSSQTDHGAASGTAVVETVTDVEPLARPVLVEVDVAPSVEPTPRPVRPAATAAPKRAPAQPRRVAAAAHTHEPTPRPAATARPAPRATQAQPAPTDAPHTYDKERVKAAIRDAWPGDDDEVIHVAGCETAWTYDPRTTSGNGMYLGLFQFHRSTWERWGGSGDPRDASAGQQTKIAWNGYRSEGWDPWPSCRPPEGDGEGA